MAIDSPYLTTREAMAYLKVGSCPALYRLIREYRMPFCRIGRLYRFDRRELDAWIQRRGTAAIDRDVRRRA